MNTNKDIKLVLPSCPLFLKAFFIFVNSRNAYIFEGCIFDRISGFQTWFLLQIILSWWVLSSILFCKNSLQTLCICHVILLTLLSYSNATQCSSILCSFYLKINLSFNSGNKNSKYSGLFTSFFFFLTFENLLQLQNIKKRNAGCVFHSVEITNLKSTSNDMLKKNK